MHLLQVLRRTVHTKQVLLDRQEDLHTHSRTERLRHTLVKLGTVQLSREVLHQITLRAQTLG